MALYNAKQRRELRRHIEDTVRRMGVPPGWGPDGAAVTPGHWPFVFSIQRHDKHRYRASASTTTDAVGGVGLLVERLVPYDEGYPGAFRYDLLSQAVAAYTGLHPHTAGDTVWFHELVPDTDDGVPVPGTYNEELHDLLYGHVLAAEGSVYLSRDRESGAPVAYQVFRNKDIDSELYYHVEWRDLSDGGPDAPLHWSTLHYFANNIID